MVRTTLTLDDDVAEMLRREAKGSSRSFKEIVNSYLRRALHAKRGAGPIKPLKIRARPLDPLPGIQFDNIEALLDQLEGPAHR